MFVRFQFVEKIRSRLLEVVLGAISVAMDRDGIPPSSAQVLVSSKCSELGGRSKYHAVVPHIARRRTPRAGDLEDLSSLHSRTKVSD